VAVTHGTSSQGGYSDCNMWHMRGRTEMCTWFLLEKHEGKIPLVGTRNRWGDKVKMHPQELWLQDVN
jgi:hypothetical protein